jgi:hypothetical protein
VPELKLNRIGAASRDKTDDIGRDVRRKDAKDTTEYSGSQAPETRREADERNGPSDTRLQPGGARGSSADVGMSGLDRDATVSGGVGSDQERIGETAKE